MNKINWDKAPEGAERYSDEACKFIKKDNALIKYYHESIWQTYYDQPKARELWGRAASRPSRFDVDAHVSNSACELAKKVRENDSAMVKKAKEILDELFDNKKSGSKYIITIKNKLGESIDVDAYDIITACNITCPAHAHAAKKVLYTGLRGHKDKATDLRESIDALERAIELAK